MISFKYYTEFKFVKKKKINVELVKIFLQLKSFSFSSVNKVLSIKKQKQLVHTFYVQCTEHTNLFFSQLRS